MATNMTKEQLEELEEKLRGQKPVAVGIQLNQYGLDFIIKSLRLLDVAKYVKEQNIEIVSSKSIVGKYQARVIYSDGKSEMINLREER